MKLTREEKQTLITHFKQNDFSVFKVALIDILQQRKYGYRDLAQESGISREALYLLLSTDSNPRFDTMRNIMKALGFKLTIIKSEE